MNLINNLIIFEGIDCSGKSTQLNNLYNYLVSLGYKVYKTREPGGTPIGEKIANLLKDKNNEIDKLTEAYLFAASRTQHNLKILDMLNQGYIILCDRHYLSSYAYQGNIAKDINKQAMNILKDNNIKYSILYFDLSYEEYKKRTSLRKQNRSLDRIELSLENENNIKSILNNYKKEALNENAIFINANLTQEKVFKEILLKIERK